MAVRNTSVSNSDSLIIKDFTWIVKVEEEERRPQGQKFLRELKGALRFNYCLTTSSLDLGTYRGWSTCIR